MCTTDSEVLDKLKAQQTAKLEETQKQKSVEEETIRMQSKKGRSKIWQTRSTQSQDQNQHGEEVGIKRLFEI